MLLVLFALAATVPVSAAGVNPLWGHWRLVSAVAYSPGKPVQHPMGEHPTGSILYTPQGARERAHQL